MQLMDGRRCPILDDRDPSASDPRRASGAAGESFPHAIHFLADRPEWIPIVAGWLYAEWGREAPGVTVGTMARRLRARMNRDRLPLALIAAREGNPLGTASLRVREMEIRPQYEHWLSTVYVHPLYRRKGVGSALVRAASAQARRLGIGTLYLYTRNPRTESLYAGLGWTPIERPVYRGRPAVIMRRHLDD